MLLSIPPRPVPLHPAGADGEAEVVSLQDVVDFLRRNALVIAGCILATMSLGGFYAFTAPPVYTAEARLIIDTSQSRIVLSEPDPYSLAMESARVDSEVELVKSRSIALSVIQRLDLENDPEYNAEPGPIQKLRRRLKALVEDVAPIEVDESDAGLRRVMGAYVARLGVRRLGQSYIIEISYQSRSAQRAAEITNAIAEAYIAAKVDSKAEAARNGARWLQQRLEELQSQSNLASAAVERFKSTQRIVKPDGGSSLAERQLLDTSVQLLQARGETGRLQARLDAVDRMIATGELSDVVAVDAGGTSVLPVLRQRMVDARARQAEILSRYGAEGSAATSAAADIEQIRAEIATELNRIRAVYRTDLDASEMNQTHADGSLETMLDAAAQQSSQYVQLAELESRASTFRRMYETMLQQFTQTVQRQSFPVSDARFVTPAVAPFVPSEPKPMLILALSGVLGAVLGLGSTLGRATLRKRVSTGRQVEGATGAPCLALLPQRRWRRRLRQRFAREPVLEADELGAVAGAPYSDFSHAMTSVKVSLDFACHAERSLLVGVTSVERDPKRSRLAGNLALLYAAEGRSTLLVDADHRRRTLTRSLARAAPTPEGAGPDAATATATPTPAAGPLVEGGEARWTTAELDGGLQLAALAQGEGGPHRTLRHLRTALEDMRWRYDVVVVDLSSMAESNDARALSPLFDVVLLSCEQGRTALSELTKAVASFGTGEDRRLGLIIDGARQARPHG